MAEQEPAKKDAYHPVMDYKLQKECCTSGTCAVSTFKTECCTRDAKPKCHYRCMKKNNPFCHDTLCCECHKITIYHTSAPEEMRMPSYVCGRCGYRVCYVCIPITTFQYDTMTNEKMCPKCEFVDY